jgi:hypothetical protein
MPADKTTEGACYRDTGNVGGPLNANQFNKTVLTNSNANPKFFKIESLNK